MKELSLPQSGPSPSGQKPFITSDAIYVNGGSALSAASDRDTFYCEPPVWSSQRSPGFLDLGSVAS